MSGPPNPDRRLTYGVLVAVMVQFAGVLIWAGGAAARLNNVENAQGEARDLDVRLARVEAHLDAISVQLQRIEHRLEDAQ